jgi:calcineurin-like phosphoesterase family protein
MYWFTADTHFGHKRTLELSKRPFKTLQEHDEEMVKRWNQVVSPNDKVFHLGDFGNYEYAKRLNGHIFLLFGNYERDDNVTPEELKEKYGFTYVSNNDVLSLKENNLFLVHEPSHRINGKFNLFGHIHSLQKVKRNGLNVGVDCHNYTPIDIDTVEFYRNAIQNHYDEEVFME